MVDTFSRDDSTSFTARHSLNLCTTPLKKPLELLPMRGIHLPVIIPGISSNTATDPVKYVPFGS